LAIPATGRIFGPWPPAPDRAPDMELERLIDEVIATNEAVTT
jgi:hypothetical protein